MLLVEINQNSLVYVVDTNITLLLFCDRNDVSLNSKCANASDPNSMINVTRNFLPSYGTYHFKSFVWSHDPFAPVYLHCKVKICDNYNYLCNLVSKFIASYFATLRFESFN